MKDLSDQGSAESSRQYLRRCDEEHFKDTGDFVFFSPILEDVTAVKKGKVGKRIIRRGAGKVTGKGMRKIFK